MTPNRVSLNCICIRLGGTTYLGLGGNGQVALATVLATVRLVLGHKDTSTTGRALLAQTSDLAVVVDAVVLQHSELNRLALVLDLLGGSVGLLLLLLGTTTQAQDKMQSGLLLDVVVREGTAILQLLAGENEALLIRGDSYKPQG